MTDSVYWIWLQSLFGIGTRRAELFMDYFQHPRQIYEGIRERSRVTGMLTATELAGSAAAMEQAESIQRRTIKKGCDIVTPDHPDYPPLLQSIFDKPAALYVIGDLGCLGDSLAIAMVGTRTHTEYGRKVAAHLCEDLARHGAVVVSGLAQGIDTECHKGALAGGGKTIGVLGCGMDVDYPKNSREIKTAMRSSGAVVTEYPLGYPPLPENFPLRNRIISGMSHGTVVAEADLKSGSLITARLAREQGREVFAVPGSIFQRGEKGTHQLIKEGAVLVDNIEDILTLYPQFAGQKRKQRAPRVLVTAGTKPLPDDAPEARVAPKAEPAPAHRAPPEGVSDLAAQVYQAFAQETLSVDDLAVVTGLGAGELLTALTELELFGAVTCYPGRRFGLL